jgi:hypothetical protein
MSDNEMPFLPQWITDSMAEQAERGAANIERRYGPCGSVDELREIAASLRAVPVVGGDDGDDE